jgi:homopolymeric O-antigen transport system permease protein
MGQTQVTQRESVRRKSFARSARADHVAVIGPATRWPRLDFGELWRFRDLLAIFVWRDVKVRYKQTLIGGVWAIFQPAFTALVYTLVFGKFAKFPSGNLPYPVFAFAGVLAWQYFSSSLNVASGSLLSNIPLVTKVYFPRLLLPIAGVLTPLLDLALALVVLVGLIAWFDTWPGLPVLTAPLFILLALFTALGASLVLSALNVRYRDVQYVIPVFMQVMPFLSGVPYSLHEAPVKWQWLLSLNPMTAVVAGWRWAVIDGPRPVPGQVAVSTAVAVGLFVFGIAYFRRSEPRFADTI